MSNSSYLVKYPDSSYCFRLVVPADLRQAIGQREIRRSLCTRNRQEAQILAWQLADQWKSEFRRLRMIEDPLAKNLTLTGVTIENGRLTADNMELDPDKADAELKLLEQLLQQVMAKVNQAQAESPLLSKLAEDYCNDRCAVGAWSKDTEHGNKVAFEQIISLIGDRPADQVDRTAARNLLTTLKKMLSSKGQPYSISVINKRLGLMSSLYKWAQRENIVQHNPFEGLQIKETVRADQQRDAYTPDELKRLFDPAWFRADPRRPSRYWVPLICAYSGCRVGEAAQLRIDSILQVDGHWCMRFDDSMRLKTANAVRTVPVHKVLLQLGLLEYVDQRKTEIEFRSSGDHRLFPELRKGAARAGGAVSNWWNNTHHKHAEIMRKEVSFHSLRHGVETRFRAAGVPETIASEIVGHERGGMSYGRYAKPGQLGPLVEAIEVIDYQGALDKITPW